MITITANARLKPTRKQQTQGQDMKEYIRHAQQIQEQHMQYNYEIGEAEESKCKHLKTKIKRYLTDVFNSNDGFVSLDSTRPGTQ